MKSEVYLREHKIKKEVSITSMEKPKLEDTMVKKWQKIINLIAKIVDIPAGLIMRCTNTHMEVLLKSENKDNPYPLNGKDSLGHGLYCETVIGTDNELFIENALENEAWKHNPDIKLGMVSYYGLPIKWEDGEFFGTICVLDKKANKYNDLMKEIINEFKIAIETDLSLLLQKHKLKIYAEYDVLTEVYNRRKLTQIIGNEFVRSLRSKEIFCIAIFDLNKFKQINDVYGHNAGDRLLKTFAQSINKNVREIDYFGRWGGDEFMLVCPSTTLEGIEALINRVKQETLNEMNSVVPTAGFSFGCSEYDLLDKNYEQMIIRADNALYEQKRSG